MYTAEMYAQKKSAAQEKLTAYVDVLSTPNHTKAAEDAAKKALATAESEYNALVISDAYERLFLLTADSTEVGPLADPAEHLKAVDPLGRAFCAYRFSGLMTHSIKKDSKTGAIKKYDLVFSADADDNKKKVVFKLRDIETKWDELQTAAGVAKKVPLMASPLWSAVVLKMPRLFRALSLSRAGYAVPSGLTAADVIDIDGQSVEVAEMTEEQKKKFSDTMNVTKMKDELQALVDAIYFDSTGRKNGSNKYRAIEKDVNWIAENAHTFDTNTHVTNMMSESAAFELAFCMIAHIVTKKPYEAIIGE